MPERSQGHGKDSGESPARHCCAEEAAGAMAGNTVYTKFSQLGILTAIGPVRSGGLIPLLGLSFIF